MCGKNYVRYFSSIIVVVFIFIGLCGFALATTSNSRPVKSAGASSTPASSTPVSGTKASATPAPVIIGINPTQAQMGSKVQIGGTGFGSARGSSYVSFGPFKVAVYGTWSDTAIYCEVPEITGVQLPVTGPVTVTTSGGTSNAVSFTVGAGPTITVLYPTMWVSNSVMPMTVTGHGFQKGLKLTLWDKRNYGLVDPTVSNVVLVSSQKITCKVTIPGFSKIVGSPLIGMNVPEYVAQVTNPDGRFANRGDLVIMPNPCGMGAISPIVGFGLIMGIMTLAGTVHIRRRREKKS